MPDFVKHSNGEIDWSKLFMGFALALVYIMQSYHAMQVADLKANMVPRQEIDRKADKIMDKSDIMTALSSLNNRLDAMEKK